MENKIMIIKNVRGYQDEKGVAQLNLEDVARGLGFTTVATSGNEVVRWNRVRQYLNEFNFDTSAEIKYIPENIFYKLCFKAKNETARKFQDLVTDEILPSIRKNGMYATDELLNNPDLAIKVFEQLKQEREEKRKLQLENDKQNQLIGELKPKADYTDKILQSKGTVKVNVIANDYGLTATALNRILHDLGIQYKQGEDWLLYAEHRGKGYTHSKTIHFFHKDGRPDTKMNMEWTQKGRLFLYELLKKKNILPSIEQEVL